MSSTLILASISLIWAVSSLLALPPTLYASVYTWPPLGDGAAPRSICYIEWPDGAYGRIDFASASLSRLNRSFKYSEKINLIYFIHDPSWVKLCL